MIYFVRPEEGEDHIKIGYAASLTERLKGLRREYGCELHVLGVMDGDLGAERVLHDRFRDLRIERERFIADERLLNFITAVAKPWNEASDIGLKSIAAIRGSDELGLWLDSLVEHLRMGTRILLVKNALREYAEKSGFPFPMPKR
jgi:hypothetical protein